MHKSFVLTDTDNELSRQLLLSPQCSRSEIANSVYQILSRFPFYIFYLFMNFSFPSFSVPTYEIKKGSDFRKQNVNISIFLLCLFSSRCFGQHSLNGLSSTVFNFFLKFIRCSVFLYSLSSSLFLPHFYGLGSSNDPPLPSPFLVRMLFRITSPPFFFFLKHTAAPAPYSVSFRFLSLVSASRRLAHSSFRKGAGHGNACSCISLFRGFFPVFDVLSWS